MGGHDPAHPRLDGGPEREELHRFQPLPGHPDDRQVQVRIDLRVPVSREVLPGGEHASFLGASGEGTTQPGNLLGILSEGTDVDDGVVRIVVHVQDGSEGGVDAQSPGFHRGDPTHLPGQLRVSRRPHRHEGGKLGGATERDGPR